MPIPSIRFQALFPLQEVIFDKDDGLPLAGGIVTFYKDESRAVLKDIYQQVQLPDNTYTFALLNNPITLSSIGSFQDSNGIDIIPFLYPYAGSPADAVQGEVELYYITVYAALPPIGTGNLQFTREAWPPNTSSTANVTTSFQQTANELSNPQFVEISFSPTSSKVFTVSGAATETKIAPDWSLISDGSGSVTVTWVPITDVDAPSNPPFALRVTSAGIDSLTLRQTLSQSPRLLSNGFISASVVARTASGSAPIPVIMTYSPSTGTPVTLINGLTNGDGNFYSISGTAAINNTNTDSGLTGYVNIDVAIPVGVTLEITSLQIVGVQNLASDVAFIEQTTARQIDHLFHYYKDQLVVQPKNTILTGWNFPLNPWQFLTTASTNIAASKYTADQTIVALETAASLESSKTAEGYFGIQAVGAAVQGKFALIQYIDASTIAPYWGNYLSSLVRAGITTVHATGLQVKMRLIYRTGAPPAVDPISSWAATDPTFTAGWTAIIPTNDPVYTINSATLDNFTFDGFLLPAHFSLSGMLGIVLYTVNTLSSVVASDTVFFDRISLVPNLFAVDSQPQTYDQVLRECFLYYEKSYAQGVLPGAAGSSGGCLYAEQEAVHIVGDNVIIVRGFGFPFKEIKRTQSPVITLYSPTGGASASVRLFLRNNGAPGVDADLAIAGEWTQSFLSSTAVSYLGSSVTHQLTTAGADLRPEGYAMYHYVADARLGLVP